MTFTIHKEKEPDRVIRVGYSPKVLPPPMENKQGRKKMADDKKISDETGVKKISEEPVKQGPVGTGATLPPTRPAQPEEGVKIGGKEERENA